MTTVLQSQPILTWCSNSIKRVFMGRILLTGLLLCGAMLSALPCSAENTSLHESILDRPEEFQHKVIAPVVRLYREDSNGKINPSCNAVVISSEPAFTWEGETAYLTLFLTAGHCMDERTDNLMIRAPHTTLEAYWHLHDSYFENNLTKDISKGTDLGLLYSITYDLQFPSATVSAATAELLPVTTPVILCGYVGTLVNYPKFVEGRIIGQAPPYNDRYCQTTWGASVSNIYGQSGSGFFDAETGELIGINIALLRTSASESAAIVPNFSAFVPAPEMRAFMKRAEKQTTLNNLYVTFANQRFPREYVEACFDSNGIIRPLDKECMCAEVAYNPFVSDCNAAATPVVVAKDAAPSNDVNASK